MSKKRHREIPAIQIQLIEIYDDLANPDEEIRLRAAQNLLLKVDSYTSEQLHEILRRLIRGLCSGRKAARLGFSVALTELLVQLFGPKAANTSLASVSDVIETLDKQTCVGGNVSGQEERDHYFGRLFGAETIIKSGVLFNPIVDIQLWSQVLDLIINLARQKSWLREECGWTLYQAIRNLGKDGHDSKYIQLIVDKIQENGLIKTPEGVAVWIATTESSPDVRLPKGEWKYDNPLHQKGKNTLAVILKETSKVHSDHDGSDSKISQKGNWNSKLHFSWEIIISHILGRRSCVDMHQTESLNELDMASFWYECVDKSLFSASSSDERKYWGFLLFQLVVRDAPSLSIDFPFSKNLMRCLINQLASSDRYLHRIAEKSVKSVLARAQLEASMTVPIIECLLSPPNGQLNFDQVTKTKTIEKLLVSVNDQSWIHLAKVLHRLIADPGTQDIKSAASKRQIIADILVCVIRSRQIANTKRDSASPEVSEGIQQILSLLAQFAYFNRSGDKKPPKNEDNPPVSPASHNMFQARLSSCLTHLTYKFPDPAFYAYHVVSIVRSMEETDPSFKPILSVDDDVSMVVQKAWNILQKVRTKEMVSTATKRPLLTAFKFLYSLTILQVYNGDADAVEVLDELQDCYQKLIKHKNQEVQGGSDILIEIILSFVSKPSQLYRRLGQQVFSACASNVSKIGLQSMFKVLMTEENLSGQENIFEDKEQVQEESEISDVEIIDVISQKSNNMPTGDNNSLTGNKPNISDSSSVMSDSADESSEADDDLADFDAKLAQALGIRSTAEDGSFHDNSDPSDEDMDDEQMEAIDSHLEKVFRERQKVTSMKSQKKDAKEMIVNFKCRVLELLEVFVKQQFTNNASLDILLPLLVTIRTTKSSLVAGKACKVMKEFSQICKSKGLPNIEDTDETVDILKAVHSEVSREGSNAFVSACSQASLLLVKTLAAKDKENLREALLVYSNTQEQALFNPQLKVKPSFFFDWLNWCSSIM